MNCFTCSHCILSKLNLQNNELEFLNHCKSNISVNKGETIIKQGNRFTSVICVCDGLVLKYLEGEHGRDIGLGIEGTGDIFGFSNFFSETNSFSALALKNSSICIFETDDFFEIFNSNQQFKDNFLIKSAYYIRGLYEKVAVIGTKKIHGRIADTVLYLEEKNKQFPELFKYISRKDIALLAGISPESTIRLLKEFEHDGIIRINGKEILVNNREILVKLKSIG